SGSIRDRPHPGRMNLSQCIIGDQARTGVGLGRVKTPAPAARVKYLGGFAHLESQIMLHTCGPMLCWRIVFSTFLRCMSFHTARVKSCFVHCSEDNPFKKLTLVHSVVHRGFGQARCVVRQATSNVCRINSIVCWTASGSAGAPRARK